MGSLRNGADTERCREDEEREEPMLEERNQRFCMFPIRYKQLWEMYKKAESESKFLREKSRDYQKASVMSSLHHGGKNFKMDEDF
ncbi:ribonucleoside-diphosphate reductase small chain A [Hevea brasiliensis]|uniref:ribonucleoside-diphosphate reductase small chain A n=1 Tax=Hevea brasiliensis TaxID=3981 RepID=UPI000B7903FC|nr:ribonucleoside-diphosphate reductase small chain A [Hevea brasiliensis]